MNQLATTTEERHDIIVGALSSLEEGKSLRDIATDIGMAYATLRVWLLDDVPEKYKPAQRKALLRRIAEADEMLESASSNIAIARAREVARFSRWDAERRLPQLFATRSEVSGPGGGPIVLTDLERARRFAFLRRQAEPIDVIAVQHEEHALTELSTENQADSLE